MATSEGIPSSIDIEFLELNDNPYIETRMETRCRNLLFRPNDQLGITCWKSSEKNGLTFCGELESEKVVFTKWKTKLGTAYLRLGMYRVAKDGFPHWG